LPDVWGNAGGIRRVFVTGKGGVGKTTVACAEAVWNADQGRSTLLVTTDPAAHLGNVLETPVGAVPGPVAGVANLYAVRIDAKAATAAYVAAVLRDAALHVGVEGLPRLQEELSSPCTEEVAVFHAFLEHVLSDAYDVVVFDTAPTGHTLRLLQLPLDYRQQLEAKVAGVAEGPSVDAEQTARMTATLERLRDATHTAFLLVVDPETTPIAEAGRAARELSELGISTAGVVCNQVLPEEACTNAFFRSRRAMQMRHIASLPRELGEVPVAVVVQRAEDVRGVSALRAMAEELHIPNPGSVQGRSGILGPGYVPFAVRD